MQNKTKIIQNTNWQPVFRVIKWTVPFFIALVLYKKFYKNATFSFVQFRLQLQFLEWHWYLVLAFFSLINWSLETWKWQYLLKKLEPLSFKTALKSMLSGVAVSQLLPYRTGEYLGRLTYISDKNKLSAGILSVAGSFSQLLVTLVFGIMAFVYIQPIPESLYSRDYQLYLGGLLVVLIIVLTAGYFYLPQFRIRKKMKLLQTLEAVLHLLRKRDLLVVLMISVLRYLSFVVPYALLAHHFNLPAGASLFYGFISIACIYFLQTVSPNFILTDIVIRLSVPALVFAGKMDSVNGIEYIPGMFIYLFNIAIPMCIGAIVLLSARIRK